MWDKIIEVGIIAIGAGVVGLASYWAVKQWKLKYRDELRAWLSNHPNIKFKKIGLKTVLAIDTVIVLAERITVDLFGKTDSGQEIIIKTKTLTLEEARKLGIVKDNTIRKNEVDLFDGAEILI